MDFFCIADRDSGLGFRLAGVETREVATKEEASAALDAALAKENVGVVIVTHKCAPFIRERIDDITYSKRPPLILEVPSRGEFKTKHAAGAMLKKAIGISV
jgi:vacuolar-type H+-ATPase subunit F/Vma7